MDTLSEYILTADTLHSEMSHREYNSQNVLGTGYYIVLLKGKMFGNNNIESTADVPGELELSRIDCTGVLAFTPTSIRSFSSFLLLSSTISLTSRISKISRHIVLLLPSSTFRTSLFLLEMAQNTTASSPLTLSTEIHLLIIDCSTKRTFKDLASKRYGTLTKVSVIEREEVLSRGFIILLTAFYNSRNRGKFGCDQCFRLRPQSKFGKIHPPPFCLPYNSYCCFDCEKDLRQPSIYINATDVPTALCMICRERRQSGYYCIRCYACESCISRQGIGVICG